MKKGEDTSQLHQSLFQFKIKRTPSLSLRLRIQCRWPSLRGGWGRVAPIWRLPWASSLEGVPALSVSVSQPRCLLQNITFVFPPCLYLPPQSVRLTQREWKSWKRKGVWASILSPKYLLFDRQVVSDSLWPPPCSTPGFPVLQCLLEFAQIHVHWVGDAIYPSHPLPLSSSLPSIFSSIRVFSSESFLHMRWPKYSSFSVSIRPPSEYSGLISFMIDWFDLLDV